MSVDESIVSLRDALLAEIEVVRTPAALEAVRVAALGKKGALTARLRQLGACDPEQRRLQGAALNRLRVEVEAALQARGYILDRQARAAQLEAQRVDVTLPAYPDGALGRLHPLTRTFDEIIAIFGDMGFTTADGPDIEDDFHNFTALNIPDDHPARQEHDTFYLCNAEGRIDHGKILRTHTSPVQVRAMRTMTPPFRIIAPGRTYRADSDMTHTPMFHQVEGLLIERDAHFGHLKGCLETFCRAFFGIDDAPLRFRASYFPFTDPSAEVDIRCQRDSDRLLIGQGDDWLEILGCGMVHPNVLRACGLDPEQWRGFAFGMGIERITMLKHGIPDLRMFFETDLRWLRHYGATPLDGGAPTVGPAS